MTLSESRTPSVAIFGPQSKIPTDVYLSNLSSYLRSREIFSPLVDAIRNLPETWKTFLGFHEGISSLDDGPRYLEIMSTWVAGESPMSWGEEIPSGMLALPILTIIHLVQYFQYLDQKGMTHAQMMNDLRAGAGIQGYCGGMLSALCVATSDTEQEVIATACHAIRIAVGVGAVADVVDDNPLKLSCIMVIRLKYEGQGEELVKRFPGTHISAITDFRTLSVTGSPSDLSRLEQYAVGQKLTVSKIPLRGKMHNPENSQLAHEFARYCETQESLRIPDACELRVKFRSNLTTQIMTGGSLTLEVARTILADKCLWYQLLVEVAKDLTQTGRIEHSLVAYGIGDCVSLEPFRKSGIKMTKLDMFSLLRSGDESPTISPPEFSSDAIAVIGMAGRFPGANDVEELWDIIQAGKSMVQRQPKERVNFEDSHRVRSDQRWASKQNFFGNFISDHDCFDHAFFKVSGKEANFMDPQQRLLLETAYQAMESSGYLISGSGKETGDRVGVFIGASFTDYLEHTTASTPNAYIATGNIRAFLSGKISHYFGWTGPSEVVDTACSSSLVAISRGVRAIQRGECATALVGGVNFMSTPTHTLDLGRASFLSPTGQCKPFDASADGYCRSEGVGLIVLKRLSEARANDDHILGVIPGISTNQGSDPKSITVPSSAAHQQLYTDILKESQIDPWLVSYVEAHGTGTQVGDPIEMDGIRKAFARPERELNIGSIKANIGHAECAAGVAGVIKAILMVNKGIVPPIANFKHLNPKIPAIDSDKIIIPTSAKLWDTPYRAVIVNSYGAAGSNAALLLCQSPQKLVPRPFVGSSTFPIMLTAGSKASLAMYAKSLQTHLRCPAGSQKTIQDVSFSLCKTLKPQKYIWTTTARDILALSHSLDEMTEMVELPQTPKKIVLAFSGQTKQFVGLDKALYDACPLLQSHLAICDELLTSAGSPSIFPSIFLKEAFSDVVSLQCCMFAFQYSFAKSWIDSGLEIAAIVGHSFGELTAMAISGVLTLESTIAIIKARANLIETKWGSDPGSMLVIHDTESVVKDLLLHLPEDAGKLEIACYNSKTSHVVAGSSSAILGVQQILKDVRKFNTLKYSKPDTTHGFHSCLTDGLLDDLDEVAMKHSFLIPKIPLEACTFEHTDSTAYERIAQHFRHPVAFHHAITRLERKLGPCIWLEAGMDTPVIPMIQRAVEVPSNHTYLPLKSVGDQDPMAAISAIITKLWCEGIYSSFFKFAAVGARQVWLPPYAFERTPAWLPYKDPTTEALKAIPQSIASVTPEMIAQTAPHRLVNPTIIPKRFTIGTRTNRFRSIVAGHSVIGNPLCPAALYLESAIMAAQTFIGDLETYGYTFWNFRIDSPLGIDYRREVFIDIEYTSRSEDWSFVLKSVIAGQVKETLHAKAAFKFFTSQTSQLASQFQYHQRFVTARLSDFSSRPNAEGFRMNRAYRLFSHVVNYSAVLTGISSIQMVGHEAMANIELPVASESDESTAIAACDTVAMDNFVQVVGLLINSCDLCTEEDAFLATGADTTTVLPGVNLELMRKFIVYASFSAEGGTKTSGDIFVLTPDGNLIAVILGMHFAKLPLATLRKILEPVNHKEDQKAMIPNTTAPSLQLCTLPQPKTVPALPLVRTTKQSLREKKEDLASKPSHNASLILALKRLVAEFAGLNEAQVSTDVLLSDLGVDSLAAIELSEELRTQFGINTASTEITSLSVNALVSLGFASKTADISHAFRGRKLSITSESSIDSVLTPSIRGSSQSSTEDSGMKDRFLALIIEYAAIDADSIDEKASLESLGVDSLSLIELKSALEEAFGVETDFDGSVTVDGLGSILGLKRTVARSRVALPDTYSPSSVTQIAQDDSPTKEDILAIIADHATMNPSSIDSSASLDVLGIDSLCMIELKSALEERYSVELDFEVSTTVCELTRMLGQISPPAPTSVPASIPAPVRAPNPEPVPAPAPTFEPLSSLSVERRDPIDAVNDCKAMFPDSAKRYGLTGYCESVQPKQDELVLAYIVEAFAELGSDIKTVTYNHQISTFEHLAKHSFVVPRLWEILVEAQIVEKRGSCYFRSSGQLPTRRPTVILQELLANYPQWVIDNTLLSITGSNLAKCLTGEAHAPKLLFGNAKSRDVLAKFYSDSPLFKPAEDILLKLVDLLVPCGNQEPFKILEVGGGTGATTFMVAEFLRKQGRKVEYTFTDISVSFVTAARKQFSQYKWMDFRTFDLEKEVPVELLSKYDFVFGTNVVHATSDATRSCTRIKSILRRDGVLVLLELTKNVNWFDLVFGLLTGWWGAVDGRTHALQSAEIWSGNFKNAGFSSFGSSGVTTSESLINQVLVGSTTTTKSNRYSNSEHYIVDTVPYKIVGDLEIEADIYYPAKPDSARAMPIALLLHGGGYMTLSRKAIRAHQTRYLLENGILPVSLDYRLCPEITIVEGSLEDMRDAMIWVRESLPALARERGVSVDAEKLLVVGWSTGGHLAMTSAWLSRNAGLKPPKAILSFYGPTDFQSDYFTTRQGEEFPERSMSMDIIQKALSKKVLSNYDGPKFTASEQNLGFLQPGDPRSELVFSLFKEGNGLSLLLNGFSSTRTPTVEQVRSISPIAQVQDRIYQTPTYIIHGDKDEVVPHTMAIDFIKELKESGVDAEVSIVPKARHIFDLMLKPGDKMWDEYVRPGYDFLFRHL